MKPRTLPFNIRNSVNTRFPALESVLKPTLLLFCLLFPASFFQQLFHEGGHALVNLSHRAPVMAFYAHPFSFVGFVRPGIAMDTIWSQSSGTVVGILVPLVIFILLWKRRSFNTLPLLLVFPWVMIFHGIGGAMDMLGRSGDVNNLLLITKWSVTPVYTFDIIISVIGIFFLLSLLPLMGIAPEDRKSLIVLPLSMTLYSLLGLVVAYLFVPGSPIDVRYRLAEEIIVSAIYRPIFMALIGFLLALIYVTLYRWAYPRLSTCLRTEKVNLSWVDLSFPAWLCAFSMALGLWVIR